MAGTMDYYNNDADSIARRMDAVDVSHVVERFVQALWRNRPTTGPTAPLLELGTGSGRDAAQLLAAGLDVTTCDGSGAMLRAAERLHPGLTGRTRKLLLAPGADGAIELPFPGESYAAIYSMATIMHLERDHLPGLFHEFARVLVHGGLLCYSVSTARGGLDAAGTDPNGRHFTVLSLEEWESVHTQAGLVTEFAEETPDGAGRAGVRWGTFHARKPALNA